MTKEEYVKMTDLAFNYANYEETTDSDWHRDYDNFAAGYEAAYKELSERQTTDKAKTSHKMRH